MLENSDTNGKTITTAKNTAAKMNQIVTPSVFFVIFRYSSVGMTIPLKQNKNAEIREINKIMFGKQNVKNKQRISGTTETRYSISTRESPHRNSLCKSDPVTGS